MCDRFYFCVDGVANPITCPASLVFDPNRVRRGAFSELSNPSIMSMSHRFYTPQGQCAFGDQVKRKGCSSEDLYNFKCPPKNAGNRHEHPRYADPTGVCCVQRVPQKGLSQVARTRRRARRNHATYVGQAFLRECVCKSDKAGILKG